VLVRGWLLRQGRCVLPQGVAVLVGHGRHLRGHELRLVPWRDEVQEREVLVQDGRLRVEGQVLPGDGHGRLVLRDVLRSDAWPSDVPSRAVLVQEWLRRRGGPVRELLFDRGFGEW